MSWQVGPTIIHDKRGSIYLGAHTHQGIIDHNGCAPGQPQSYNSSRLWLGRRGEWGNMLMRDNSMILLEHHV